MAESIYEQKNPAKAVRKEAAVASAKKALTSKPGATADGATDVILEDEALRGTRDEGRAQLRCLCGREQAWTEQNFGH